MYRLTHSEWQLGLMSLFTNLPMLLLGVFGGLAADRITRKYIVMATQTVFLLQATALAVLTATGLIEPWHVYGLGLLFGFANAFDIPARQAMMLDMSSREDLISAVSLNSMIFNLARIVGPAIGGFAVAVVGEATCFALNAVSFFAVLVVLILMRMPSQSFGAGNAATLADGFRYLVSTPQSWRLLLLCCFMNIGFSGVFVLNPFFADELFGLGSWGLGWLTASMGCGAVAGTYFLAASRDAARLPRVSLVSGLGLGLALAAYAVSPAYLFSLVCMALAGGCLMRQNAATNSAVQTATPEHLRGRIVSFFGTSVVGMAPIGATFFGGMARATGIRVAAFSAGALCVVASLALWRGLRRHGALVMLLMLVRALPAADASLLRKVDLYIKEASELTGFPIQRKVPAAMMSSAELERFLKSKMKEEVDPNKVNLEELVLKRFGFAPADFKLRDTTLELLQEQAAAFYDFKAKKLFVLDHVQEGLGPELLIHELGHALADQRYGLSKFLKGAKGDDDAALARMAVMEGQAMWLMGEHAARLAGTTLKASPDIAERLSANDDGGGDQYPVMKRVPLYLKESLLFPYSWGFRFQLAVCEKHTDCMKRVFEHPPASSSQVMHPELYFAGTLPEKIAPPAAPKGQKWKAQAEGTLGEIDMDLLLRTYGKKDPSLTYAFRGGSYRLYEAKKTKDVLLSHASIWKDEESAGRWFTAYGSLLASKWKKCDVQLRSPDLLEGVGDYGAFRLRRTGKAVFAEEGLPVH
jgi:MFS family permease